MSDVTVAPSNILALPTTQYKIHQKKNVRKKMAYLSFLVFLQLLLMLLLQVSNVSKDVIVCRRRG